MPTGKYDARLDVKGSLLDIENFRYQAENGSLSGLAKIKLPTEKQQLSWSATLKADNFNPQTVATAAPVNLLNGQIVAKGFAKPNQQIIQFDNIDLNGQLAQSNTSEKLHLKEKVQQL